MFVMFPFDPIDIFYFNDIVGSRPDRVKPKL